MLKNLLSYIIILILLISVFGLQCGEQNIPLCTKCKTDSEGCAKCEDKYFPFFNDLMCKKCDDATYGNIGCGGTCDGSNYIEKRNIICEENGCKEGFYDINGICFKCSYGSPNCSKCSYL